MSSYAPSLHMSQSVDSLHLFTGSGDTSSVFTSSPDDVNISSSESNPYSSQDLFIGNRDWSAGISSVPTLETATHQQMLRSNNETYRRLVREKEMLESSLAESRLNYDKLMDSYERAVLHGGNGTAIKSSNDFDWSMWKPEDYPKVTIWREQDWDIGKAKQDALAAGIHQQPLRGKNPNKSDPRINMGYIQYPDGSPVVNEDASSINAKARSLLKQIWSQYPEDEIPHAWGDMSMDAESYYRQHMLSEFPYLRLAVSFWKVDYVGKAIYSRERPSRPNERKSTKAKRGISSEGGVEPLGTIAIIPPTATPPVVPPTVALPVVLTAVTPSVIPPATAPTTPIIESADERSKRRLEDIEKAINPAARSKRARTEAAGADPIDPQITGVPPNFPSSLRNVFADYSGGVQAPDDHVTESLEIMDPLASSRATEPDNEEPEEPVEDAGAVQATSIDPPFVFSSTNTQPYNLFGGDYVNTNGGQLWPSKIALIAAYKALSPTEKAKWVALSGEKLAAKKLAAAEAAAAKAVTVGRGKRGAKSKK